MLGSLIDPGSFRTIQTPNGLLVETIAYDTQRILNCKLRWRGKCIHEIFRVEFALDVCYVDSACKTGKIQLNGAPCDGSKIVENGDIITHTWTAVEPPITIEAHSAPRILKIDSLSPVVSAFKPHALATVPQGKFFRLNLTSMMKQSLNSSFLQPINRLDRAVSGLVLFSTDPTTKITVVGKKYIAEVSTNFPDCITESCSRLRVEKHTEGQVLRTVIDEMSGSDSKTLFRRLSKNFVECYPITGRTHQIRVHLAGLGYPIVGDHTYSESGKNKMQQPEKINLFCVEYQIKVNGSDTLVFRCPVETFPSWLPVEIASA